MGEWMHINTYIYIHTEMGIHDMYYTYMLTTLKPLVIETVINHNHQQMGI